MFEIRDHTQPHTEPLGSDTRARTSTYAGALEAVDYLHRSCHEQLAANGEGGRVIHRLVVVDVTDPATPALSGTFEYEAADGRPYVSAVAELLAEYHDAAHSAVQP